MKFSPVLFLLVLVFTAALSLSQTSGTVTYIYRSNGNDAGIPPLTLQYSDNIANYVNSQGEEFYFDYTNRKTYQSVILKDNIRYTTEEQFDNYPKPELTDETEVILGYKCLKAKVVIRSNHIDIWYTTDAGIKGSPQLNIGPELGLVLKVVRNGNFEIIADKVVVGDNTTSRVTLPADFGEILDLPSYREKVTENNFTTIRIFTDEKINYGDTIVNPPVNTENITYRYSKGTVIMKKITLPENMQGNTVYAELTERSNGDAYDRTGMLFAVPITDKLFLEAFKNNMISLPEYVGNSLKIDQTKHYLGFTLAGGYLPPIELMRFITPFGIGHYNSQVIVKGIEWEDSVTYKQDVTELLGTLQGEVWIGVFIGCYDRGGHIVSLKLKYHPDDINQHDVPQKKYWVTPLVNTVNIMEAIGQEYGTIFLHDTVKVIVDIPEGLKNLALRYISTGHGGWGNGDEFNKKMNEIF